MESQQLRLLWRDSWSECWLDPISLHLSVNLFGRCQWQGHQAVEFYNETCCWSFSASPGYATKLIETWLRHHKTPTAAVVGEVGRLIVELVVPEICPQCTKPAVEYHTRPKKTSPTEGGAA